MGVILDERFDAESLLVNLTNCIKCDYVGIIMSDDLMYTMSNSVGYCHVYVR